MLNPLRALEDALSRHVSPINARAIIERSRRSLADPNRLALDDRTRFLTAVRATVRLFTSDDKAVAILDDFERRLQPGAVQVGHETLVFRMNDENDLRAARAAARDTCLAFAARATDAQRVATAVSELGRNIIAYTPGGQIEIEVRRGPPLRVRLLAVDHGSGIRQLDEVLAGSYRSKTGLGRGLLGVKRLMDQFRVQSGPDGTRIEAEVTLVC
jgi:serine/threonine-protein kinase RsbT